MVMCEECDDLLHMSKKKRGHSRTKLELVKVASNEADEPEEEEEEEEIKVCENCEEEESEFVCHDCEEHYCASCFLVLHKSKKKKSHDFEAL